MHGIFVLIFIGLLVVHQSMQVVSTNVGQRKKLRLHNTLRENECKNRHGIMLPIPGNCYDFNICVNGIAVLSSCGPQHHFNAERGVCDNPLRAGCVAAMGPIEIKPTTQPTLLDIGTKICRDSLYLGSMFAVPENCSRYFICLENHVAVRSCGNFHFDPIISACVSGGCPQTMQQEVSEILTNSPEYLKDNGLDNHMGPTVTSHICTGVRTGTLLAHSFDCGKFIICDNNVAVEMACPFELHFSVKDQRCELPQYAQCKP